MYAHELRLIYNELREKEREGKKIKYYAPSLWAPVGESANAHNPEKTLVNPYRYYAEHIERILNFKHVARKRENRVENLAIYNSFIRATAAFDHNNDGLIGEACVPSCNLGSDPKLQDVDITINKDGIRETGTFLKTIAQLGHLERLGCNCLYLLPVTKIGKFGNKGNLGSPYAIKNPYELDERLADPLIDADAQIQCKALVQACHLLGIKVIMEFVFRTGSRDSDWAKQHPEWFYWINANLSGRKNSKDIFGYGNPIFDKKTLKSLKARVKKINFLNLPEPPQYYKDFYYLPPSPGAVRVDKNGKLTGVSTAHLALRTLAPSNNVEFFEVNSKNSSINERRGPEGRRTNVMLPGAFADWPPDDVQPPWTDVTYLRMYKYKGKCGDYNYMAYNTIRMYEKKLARDEYANKPLWRKIEQIIPHYQNQFGIDGVLIDMGHAMPKKLMNNIISIAKKNKKDFIFLSENFHIGEESKKQGYHAVMGFSWGVEHDKGKVMPLLKLAGVKNIPVKFLASGENHNTPRAASRPGGIESAKNAFLINAFMPNGILFIHSGFELAETHPVNTGLDFTPAQVKRYGNKPLGLFDVVSYDWLNDKNIIKFMQDIMYLRDDYREIISLPPQKSYKILKTKNKNIIGFARRGKKDGKKTALMVLINYSKKKEKFKINIYSNKACLVTTGEITDYLAGKTRKTKGKYFEGALKPFEGRVFVVR